MRFTLNKVLDDCCIHISAILELSRSAQNDSMFYRSNVGSSSMALSYESDAGTYMLV